jgi:YfiH family protein
LLSRDSRQVYRFEPFLRIPWLEHGFGTRLSEDWTAGLAVAKVRQIHSDRVIRAGGQTGWLGEGDALISDRPDEVLLAIRTADCLPLLMVDEPRRAVAAVHAGWRGTAAGIAARAVEALQREFGTAPEDLRVSIGPGIGPCCYEVGPEVAAEFQRLFPERSDLNGRTKIDLPEANRRQLRQIGVPEGQIFTAGLCTACRADEFHSFRRDRGVERMVSAIGIRG